MGINLLPCEIFHREFDAKLLLACRLASQYHHNVIIGYDKHFNHLILNLPSSFLLEKSCSRIMWEGRIKPCKERGGSVIVSDEEGINNLHIDAEATWINRVDPKGAKCIDIYACWGSYDYEFFSKIPELTSKLQILGNCRLDLLGELGKEFYAAETEGMKDLFGSFILCNDNFSIENRKPNYLPPDLGIDKISNIKAAKEFASVQQKNKIRRENYCEIIEGLISIEPATSFILRPHPVADPRWWNDRFWKSRNVHVIYHLNVEPWIHSAKALISMGCTTGMQSIMAGTPVIEIQSKNELESARLTGLAKQFTPYHVKTTEELIESINSIDVAEKDHFTDLGKLQDLWFAPYKDSTTSNFSKIIDKITPKLDKNQEKKFSSIIRAYALEPKVKTEVHLDPIKWPSPDFYDVHAKIKRWSTIIGTKPPTFKKISHGLYLLSPG